MASTIDGEARYVFNQPYEGGKMVVAEAYRNLIAVGATPLAMTDCLNYGSPEKKEIYQQLIDSTKGMSEACEVLKTPVVSGNVSLYNETRGTSIFPTPVVGMVGLIEDIDYLKDFHPEAGHKLYLVGETRDDFGGSQVEKLLYGKVNHEFEAIDLSDEVNKGEAVKNAIRSGVASHVQTVGKGGLLITLARISAHYGLGLEASIDLSDAQLFSETQGRYIIVVKEGQTLNIDEAIEIGQLTDVDEFKVTNAQSSIVEKSQRLKKVGKNNCTVFNYSGLNEECGVFGIWNHSEAAQLTYMGLHSLQHRGQEGAGIVVSDGEILKGERGLGLLTEAIKGDQMDQLKDGHNAIGHVRYATSGNKGIENIQPFLYHFYDMSVAICHNGNLINAQTLRQYLEKHGAIFHSSSDTEVIMHLIRRSKAPTFEEALKELATN